MRDKNRIDTILNSIGNIWRDYPDLRLGQLLLNVVNDPKLYYIEDENLVEELETFYNSIKQQVIKEEN